MLTAEQLNSFKESGFLVLEDWVNELECEQLKAQMHYIINENSDIIRNHRSIFSTTTKDHEKDKYFLDSAEKISFFFEKDAFSSEGEIQFPPERALNKVGHALHQLDPVFKKFALDEKISGLCKALSQYKMPLCIQSMYIFKQANIGGEVVCHQDSTFIHTKSGKLLGMWLALEDADRNNGCLWGIPGKYSGEPRSRLIRDGSNLSMKVADNSEFDLNRLVPIEVKKGSLVVFNGLFPHLSYENKSEDSRHALTLHWVDGREDLSPENWLSKVSA
ncbi:MAG: phytanoyl-CoA dioxygenase family protein [Oligoflexales bacterium]|nr:phytanoyl-CoA dioxygenase family protein [Oligoflexales bacterium]